MPFGAETMENDPCTVETTRNYNAGTGTRDQADHFSASQGAEPAAFSAQDSSAEVTDSSYRTIDNPFCYLLYPVPPRGGGSENPYVNYCTCCELTRNRIQLAIFAVFSEPPEGGDWI